MQNNVYNFEVASTEMLYKLFDMFEAESKRTIETPVFWDQEQGIMSATNPRLSGEGAGDRTSAPEDPQSLRPSAPPGLALVYPALDLALKCSHAFNLLDARGAISVTERAAYINRIRGRVRACCLKYVEQFKVREPA
jgi:glycyl-tRNA synthetase alpha chain